jgi:hypothetical protein
MFNRMIEWAGEPIAEGELSSVTTATTPPSPMPVESQFAHTDRRGRRSSIRPELNFTELAAAVGVGPDHLSKLFRGKGNPSVLLAERLAAARGISLEQQIQEFENARARRKKAP